MISETQKQRILEAIAANRRNYPSDAKHASALGISASVYNGLKKGQTEKALSDANWVNIARKLDVNLREPPRDDRMERGTDGDFQIYQPAVGCLPGTQPERNTLRPSEHRQNLYCALVRKGTP